MTTPLAKFPVTALRRSFEYARSLAPADQVRECVHQLTHPEQLAGAVLDAWELMELSSDDLEAGDLGHKPEAEAAEATVAESYFWPTRELMVLGDRCSFTCIATNLNTNPSRPDGGDGLSTGVDYVGLTCDSTGTLVLGAVQAPGDTTAYPLLLRLFACLTEMAPAPLFEHLNQRQLMGIVGPQSRFDLNLVLWDRNEHAETNPISELTRDLAEKLKGALVASDSFPKILRDVVCLRMNPDRFDGRMRFDWRV